MKNLPKTSDLLKNLILEDPRETLTLDDILSSLNERAYGFLIFLFAFPNCLPMPPGFSTITGLPILWLVFQFLFRPDRPHLPDFLLRRKFSRDGLAKSVNVILPTLTRMEKLFQPRALWLSEGWGEKCVAFIMLLLTVVLVLPMPPPFNLLPAGCIAVMAIGMIERDGAVIGIGAAAGTATLVTLVVFADVILHVLQHIFKFFGGLIGL